MQFDEIPKPGLWKRLLAACFLVVFAAAGATTVAAFNEVDKIQEALDLSPELSIREDDLAETYSGKPQTLLILGSDKRPKGSAEAGGKGLSDTIMLVRLHPDKESIAIMSLPRDLKVEIPGYGVDKINAAYSYGGPQLTFDTVQKLTGLPINHVINVTFRGFWRSVRAIGCVYADIDRDYFNDSAAFEYIDIDPGYQRLCSRQALQYVRFRHYDSDLVRSARQQDFLRQAKQQITFGELFDKREKLMRIFGRNTSRSPSLRSKAEILRLVKLAVVSAGKPIQEIHFEGTIGPSYVEATSAQVKRLVQQFLNVEDTPGPRGEAEPRPDRKRKRRRGSPSAEALGLYDASALGEDQGLQAVQAGAGGTLPVMYPTLLANSSEFAQPPRVYKGRTIDGERFGAYRMVVQMTNANGEYYGVQGITWKDPPILAEPTETRRIGGRQYELHYAGDRLRLVAWKTDKAAYWISNTLLQTLTAKQMIAIARSVRHCC